MAQSRNYIVQYVGFTTQFDTDTFIEHVTSYAEAYKSLGAKAIDVYEATRSGSANFMVRIVWEAETYLQHFPSGVASASNEHGIAATQFGGYGLPQERLKAAESMKLVFLHTVMEITEKEIGSYLSATASVPHAQVLEFSPLLVVAVSETDGNFTCTHLKKM